MAIYHAMFYGIELILIAIAALIIFNDLDPRLPLGITHVNSNNIVGKNPGLSFSPMSSEKGLPNSLIRYHLRDREETAVLVQSLRDFFEVYRNYDLTPGRKKNVVNCDHVNPPPPGRVCNIDVREFGRCIAENNFNYHKASPCVLLRLDMPPGWTPEYYNDSSILPPDMPTSLSAHITNLFHAKSPELNSVWVSCEGETPADVEFLGPTMYFPSRGFPGYLTRNNNVEGYLSPVMAIMLERPTLGILINIKCKAWARNIKHDANSALGAVQFQLMIDQFN